ncbi:hypothetical protein V1477_009278 [Vespula maculifrons]|uniref:Uncharacterized protein n=1 Tax=Vespula maculifrons TaxID=7453 RepID=A0ABD2C9K0_VESMC
MSMAQPTVEVTHSEKKEKDDCEEEIRWFDNYERQLRTEATESLKREDFLNYFRYIQRNYCREISSEDDYRSSSVRELENVRRSVRGVKGKRMKSSRTKQGFGSRHRKARPKRKKNEDYSEPCCPLERTDVDCDIQPLSGYPCVNKSHRPKVTYPSSRLIRRHSSRLVSPKLYSRYIKRDLTRDYPGNIDIKVIHDWPDIGTDQRVPRSKDKVYRLETRKIVQRDSFEESLRKRSTDSIYINPRFDPNLNHEEAAAVNGRKELEVHRYVDKMNESSFQKRLSGGSNFSGSTNNQYCPRLNGPCSCEEETNKSRNFNCEKDVLSSSKRKEEKKICEKNFDWIFKDPPCTKSKPRYPSSRSFSSLSSTRSTKGVTFDKKLAEMPIFERTPCQIPRSSRKSDKSSFVEKKVHYEPKCIRMSDLRKDEEDFCYVCENKKIDNIRNRKLCKLVRSKEGKVLMKCCCSDNEQENNTKCNDCCCCPENRKQFQARQKCDLSTTYEKYPEDKNYLHTNSLSGNNFRIDSSDKPAENICKRKEDLSLKTPFLDHWKKCNERLKEVSEDYEKLSTNLKTMRDICYRRNKTRRKTDGSYPPGKDSSFGELRDSPKRTIDVRSSFRPNEIEENNDCDCREFFRETLQYPYDRYGRSMKRHETKHDTKSKKKLEKDSIRKLEGFCDRVKTLNRSLDTRKGNPESKALNENRLHQECRYDSETSVQELWRPIKTNNISRKEWPCNTVDLRIVKPKNSSGKTSLEKILIYPPDDVTGPPLTLFKNSSNISCQVKGNEDNGYRYNVTYVQKFISPIWRPEVECPSNKIRHRRDECDCSSDYG